MVAQLLCVAKLVSCADGTAAEQRDGPPAHLPTAVEPRTCLQPPPCDPAARYRRFDGSCNNLRIPTWGMTRSPYARLLPADYADGIWAPRKSKNGSELPNIRRLRTTLLPDRDVDDPQFSLLCMQWGQLVAHDGGFGTSARNAEGVVPRCCANDGGFLPDDEQSNICFPIHLPDDDSFYAPFAMSCMSIPRIQNTHLTKCSDSAAEQINSVNHLLDASIVYGNSDTKANELRTFKDGTLRIQKLHGQDYLPNAINPKQNCFLPNKEEKTCYVAGDPRVNIVPQITALHTLLLRAHNKLANDLSQINSHWNDETLYQEARRLLIAQFQHITYNEYLPAIIGLEHSKNLILLPTSNGHIDTYMEDLNPATLSSFTASAFRTLHSQIQGTVQLANNNRSPASTFKISEWMNRPTFLHENNRSLDNFLNGMVTQPAQKFDKHHTQEITNLFNRRFSDFGIDLITIDIMRNRDYGLPSYNAFRELCGLKKADTFQDYKNFINNEDIILLEKMYQHPDDVDLTVGSLLEKSMPGAIVGFTARCIIGEQFLRWKYGDRFYYEFSGFTHSFSSAQITEIKKTTFARLMCDNSDDITMMQPAAFRTLFERNTLIPCDSPLIPQLNLTAWKVNN